MADQLRLDIQVVGGDAALGLLNQIDARLQSMPATAQRAGAGQQSAAQATGAAWQQAATVTAAGWDRSAAQMEARQDRASAAIASAANRAADAQDRAAIRASQSALREFDRQIAAADQLAAKQAALAAQGDVILGAGLTAGATALTGALEKSVQEAATFQRTFTDVDIVLRPTAEGMAQLQQRAIDLGASTQFSSQQIATGFYELASAGLNEREVLAAIEPAIQAATLGHQQLGQTTLTVASVMRQFGLDAADVPKIIDVQTVAVRNSLLHWGELDEAYRGVQGAARFMGVSLEETTAALEIQRNAGASAANAGTAFRIFLDRLAKQEGEAGAAIREMNLHVYNQAGGFVGIIPLMQQIEAATAKMSEADRNRVVTMLAGEKGGGFLKDSLVALKEVEINGQAVTLHGSEVLKYFAEQNLAAAGASKAANAEIEKTLSFQWQTFTASIQEGAIRLGTQFVPAATAGAGAARELVNQFVNAPVATQQMAAAFTAIGAAALGTAGLVAGTAGAFALMGTSVAAAAVTLAPFAIGIAAVAAASAVFAAAWINDWGNIRETTAEVATRVQTDLAGIGAAANALGTEMHGAAAEVGSLFEALGRTPEGQALGGALGGLAQQAQGLGLNWGDAFKAGIALALGPGALAVPAIEQWLHAQGAEAQAAAAEAGKQVGDDFVTNVVQAIIATAGTQGSAVGQAAAQLRAEFVGRGFSEDEAATKVQEYMDRVVAALNSRRAEIGAAGQQTGAGFTDGAVAGLAPLPERVAAILENVKKVSKQTGETTGYDYAAGILDALRAGDAAAATSILELERATAFYAQTLRTLTPAQAVHAEQLRLAGNEQSALDQLVAEGTVKLADYQEAVMGTAKAHGTAKSVLDTHDAALKKLAGSTDEATAADAKATQALDKLIESEAKHYGGAFVGYTQALIAQNRETEAAAAIENQLGVAHGTLAAAADGFALAQQALADAGNRAKEAALGGALAERARTEALAAAKEADLGGALAIYQHTQALETDKRATLEASGVADLEISKRAAASATSRTFQDATRGMTSAQQDYYKAVAAVLGEEEALNRARAAGIPIQSAAVQDRLAAEKAFAEQMARPVLPTKPGEVGRYGATGFHGGLGGGPGPGGVGMTTMGGAGAAETATTALTAPFETAAQRVDTLATQINTRLTAAVADVATRAQAVGAATANGVASGINDGAPAVDTAITDVVTDAITAAQATLGIASPSAVAAADVGAPISQGVADGITAESPAIQAAAQDAAATVGPAMAAQIRDDWPQVEAALHQIADYAATLGPAFADGARHAAAEVAPALQDGLSYAEIQTAVATLGDETARGLIAAMNTASGPARDEARAELRQAVADQQAATDAAAAEAASSAATAAQDALAAGFAVLRTMLDDAQGTAGQAGTATGANWAEAVVARVEAGQPVLSETFQAAVSTDAAGTAATAAGQEVGNDLIQGIVQGIAAHTDAVAQAVLGAGQQALDAAKHFFGIASPSQVMADEVGVPLMEGIGAGIAASQPALQATLQEQVQTLVATLTVPTLQIPIAAQARGASAPASRGSTLQQNISQYAESEDPAQVLQALEAQNATTALTTALKGLTLEQQAEVIAQRNAGNLMAATTEAFALHGRGAEAAAAAIHGLKTAEEALGPGGAGPQARPADWGLWQPPGDPALVAQAWLPIGVAIHEGLATGLQASTPQAGAALTTLTTGLLDQVKGALGIHSPSTAFAAQVGEPISEGIAAGITAAGDKPVAAVNAEVAQIVAAMQQTRQAQIALPGAQEFTEWTKALDGTVVGLGLARDGADKAAQQYKALDNVALDLTATADKAAQSVSKIKDAWQDFADGSNRSPSTPDFVEDVARQFQQLPVVAEAGLQRLQAAGQRTEQVFASVDDKISTFAKSTIPALVAQALASEKELSAINTITATLTTTQAAEVIALKNQGQTWEALNTAIASASLGYQDIAGIMNNEQTATERLTGAIQRNAQAHKEAAQAGQETAAIQAANARAIVETGGGTVPPARGGGVLVNSGSPFLDPDFRRWFEQQYPNHEQRIQLGQATDISPERMVEEYHRSLFGSTEQVAAEEAQKNAAVQESQKAITQAAELAQKRVEAVTQYQTATREAGTQYAAAIQANETQLRTSFAATQAAAVQAAQGIMSAYQSAQTTLSGLQQASLIGSTIPGVTNISGGVYTLEMSQAQQKVGEQVAASLSNAWKARGALDQAGQQAADADAKAAKTEQEAGRKATEALTKSMEGLTKELQQQTLQALTDPAELNRRFTADAGRTLNITVQGNDFYQADVSYISAAADAAEAAWDVRK